MKPDVRRPRRALSHLLATLLFGAAALAHAADAAQAYRLPPGPLGRTLSTVALGAGLPLSFDPALTQGLSSPALEGTMAPRAALERLLAGSGLALEQRGDGSLTLRKATQPPAPAAAPPAAAATVPATMQQVEVVGSFAGDDPDDPRSAGRSRGATRLDLSLRETPQSLTVVSRRRIEDQRLETLQDVISQATGLTLSQASTSREADQVYARGFAVDTYLLDGIPASSLLEPAGFDTAVYERVEVLRGAAGLVSGSGSPAAAVNMVRKRPTADTRVTAAAQAGSWDRYRIEVDASAALAEHVRGRIVAAHQDQKSYVDRYAQKKDLLYGIVEADLGPDTLLSAGVSYQDERLDGASRMFPSFYADGTRTDLPRSTNSAARFTYYDRTQSLVFASLEHGFAKGWTAKLALNRAENHYDAVQGYAMQGYLDRLTGAGLSLWLTKWDSKPVQASADAYATGPFTLLGRRHDAVFGATVSRMHDQGPLHPSWVLPGYDASVPDFYTWNGDSPTPDYSGRQTGRHDRVDRQRAAYGTLRLRPLDRLQVIAGARVTDWRRDTVQQTFGAATLTDRFRKDGKVVPYAGMTYELDGHWSAYASYTSIFAPQTQRDRENRLLDPLEGNNKEIGVKGTFFGGALNATAALFHLRQDNLAEIDEDMFWVPGTGGGSYAYHTVEGATAQGAEVEINGQLRRGWLLTAGYAHAKAEDPAGRRLQTGQPLNSFKLWTTVDLSTVTLGGGVQWQSDIYQDGAGPNGERFLQSGYALVGLMARCRLGSDVTATVNVNNLLDRKYYAAASGGFYGEPRNVMVSLAYRFR